MAELVVIGAGLSGSLMAYELLPQLWKGDRLTVVSQIPPRNANWSSKGDWVHCAKVAFEKYFLRKIRRSESKPFYERFPLDKLNIAKINAVRTDNMIGPDSCSQPQRTMK